MIQRAEQLMRDFPIKKILSQLEKKWDRLSFYDRMLGALRYSAEYRTIIRNEAYFLKRLAAPYAENFFFSITRGDESKWPEILSAFIEDMSAHEWNELLLELNPERKKILR